MASSASILILERDAGAWSAHRELCEANGVRTGTCAETEQAAGSLAGGEWDALLIAPQHVASPAVVRVLHTAQDHDVELVLGATGAVGTAELELALQHRCAGVLSPASAGGDVHALFGRIRERRARAGRLRGEQRRLRVQSDELQQRCTKLAERFQETRETFYIDLSRLMTIITNIMDGIVFVDRAGNVTMMNPVAEDLLDAKSFTALGKPISSLHGRTDLLQTLAADHARMATHKEVVQTVEVHHNEQDLLYIKCMTSRVHDYRGQPAGVLTVLRDVTAEFKTDQLKNQYLSIVAHELRTPLTGIKTFATMMSKGTLGALNDRQQRVCDSIREQSVRLEHQIDKLINLGNLESADYGQDREVIPVADFAAGLLAPFEQPARDRRIELSFTDEAGDEQLFADRADLRRACQALVENAVKFARDGGRVEVAIERFQDGQQEGLRFRVRDDGIGIDPRYHRRIFEKFFQVEDPLTRHHGGAGLGLFVSRGIVEAHGSRIEVSSQLGQGADFSFALPVHRQLASVAAPENG